MTFLVSIFLLGIFLASGPPHARALQFGVRNDVLQLRQYLGRNYRGVIQGLDSQNQILLRNTEPLAPAQAAEMRARMNAPASLPADRPILPVTINDIGQGLVSFLFEDDFLTEQVNFVFCAAKPDVPERLMAIQVFLDDSRALQPAATLLQTVYRLPQPLPSNADYKLALTYPLRSNLPLTVWNLDTAEAIYQPILGQQLVTGQLWLTDKRVVAACTPLPKLPGAP